MTIPEESQPTERRRVVFHGRVQGVGFRYTTVGIAKQFAVSGYVKNLRNGTVELVAEGTAAMLDRFIEAVSDEFADNITERVAEPWAGPAGDGGFSIGY